MRLRLIGFGLLIAMLGTTSPSAQEPPPLGDLWLEGTVGQAQVRVYLGDAGFPKTDGLWGMYYYSKYWIPIPLDGTWVAAGRVRFFEGDPGRRGPKARFDLRVSGSEPVTGTWTSADEGRTLRVTLRRIRKPAPFEAAVLARRFVHPNWPITFAYPSDWRLDVDDRVLTLRSPDPEDMMFDNQLSCQRGSGIRRAPAAGEPPVRFEGPFFRAATGWLVESGPSGACDPDDDTEKGTINVTDRCRAPEIRSGGPGTFMRTEIGYGAHNSWGYAGLGGAAAYLIVVGDEWVHCTDRVLDSDTRIGVREPAPRK